MASKNIQRGNLCSICGAAMKISQKGWCYCPNKYSTSRPCSQKGWPAYQQAKTVEGEIEPLTTMSAEQTAVVNAAQKGKTHLLVRALAGTGKTTVMVQCVRVLSDLALTILCLCFSNRDKDALRGRVKSKAKVFNFHGAGLSILSRYARSHGVKLQISDNIAAGRLDHRLREDGVIREENGKTVSDLKGGSFGAILNLVEKARLCLPMRATGEKRNPSDADWSELADRFGIEISTDDTATIWGYASWLFSELASLRNMLSWGVDATGMIFLPVYHELRPETLYARIVVDECQDQSAYNRDLAFSFLEKGGRMIAVGDENQAIYEWRGADSDSVNEMLSKMKATGLEPQELPLTLCRRCARQPISLAQTLVPQIQALPEAPEGEIDSLQDGEALLETLKKERRGLVISRVNAPLISLCLKLLGAGVRAKLARSNIGPQLLQLVDKLSDGNDGLPVTDLLTAARLWLEDTLAKLATKRNGEKQAQIATDKYECLTAVAEAQEVNTAGNLKRKLDSLFPKEYESLADTIILSTVHGAKGGEAHTVYLYSPPGKKGSASCWDQIWTNARDRDNTLYVAVTRAEFRVVVVGPPPTWGRFTITEE
jgi:hypothetical protein